MNRKNQSVHEFAIARLQSEQNECHINVYASQSSLSLVYLKKNKFFGGIFLNQNGRIDYFRKLRRKEVNESTINNVQSITTDEEFHQKSLIFL